MYRGIKAVMPVFIGFLGAWFAARFLLPIAAPFLLGLALALTADPLVSVFQRRFHLPRSLAAGVGVSLTFCAVAIFIVLLCGFALRELGLLAGILPNMEQTARTGITLVEQQLLKLTQYSPQSLQPLLQQNVRGFFSDGAAVLNRCVQYVLGLAGRILTHVPDSALLFGTGIISAFMISAKLPRMRVAISRMLPRQKLQPVLEGFQKLKGALGGWLLAQAKLIAVCAGILLAGLVLLGIPYAPLWALGISLVDAFPILGTGTVLLPWSLVLFLQGDTPRALGILGIYTVVSVSRSVLEPRFLGRQLGLDPLVTLAALYAGYKIWGIGGMIVAPLLAVAAIQLLPQQNGKL